MEARTLTITVQPDWQAALRSAGKAAQSETYQGETLNFESADVFLGRLTALRWSLLRQIMRLGEVPIRELARQIDRDVRRVHDDVVVLTELGLIERQPVGAYCVLLWIFMWICIFARRVNQDHTKLSIASCKHQKPKAPPETGGAFAHPVRR